jgi:hypothetical protein
MNGVRHSLFIIGSYSETLRKCAFDCPPQENSALFIHQLLLLGSSIEQPGEFATLVSIYNHSGKAPQLGATIHFCSGVSPGTYTRGPWDNHFNKLLST